MTVITSLSEFELIDHIHSLFSAINPTPAGAQRAVVGSGDDAALVQVAAGQGLALSTDTLVENVHFTIADFSAESIGHKALAANLSDLAAMGAKPLGVLLSLSLPESTTLEWVEGFTQSFARLASQHGVALWGGNVSRASELSISITIAGERSLDRIGLRSGAKPGHAIFVSGTLGDARAGLNLLLEKKALHTDKLIQAQLYPQPSVELGLKLIARPELGALIDISDGLSGDLAHIARASGLTMRVDLERLPVSPALRQYCQERELDPFIFAASAGEDYRLCFTAPKGFESSISNSEVFAIGEVAAGPACNVVFCRNGSQVSLPDASHRHF